MRCVCLLAAAGLALAGCGDTRGERTLSGAGIGAGAGAIIGAVTGIGPVTGTIVGAAAGGITGMVTDKSQLNLGDESPSNDSDTADARPPQAEPDAAARQMPGQPQEQALAPAAATVDSKTIKTIQTGLARLCYEPGPADGVAGVKTRAAIRAFQEDAGLPADGEPSKEVARRIEEQVAARSN